MPGVVQCHLLFHLRRLVRDRGALSPEHQVEPVSLISACRLLSRTVWESLPSSIADQVWSPPGQLSAQCTNSSNLILAQVPSVHVESALLPKTGVYTTQTFTQGQVLAVLSSRDPLLGHFLPSNCSGSLPQSQVFLSHFQCDCGAYHIRLTASDTVLPFTFLTLAPARHSSTLLIQFDGSARQSEQIGGAGVVALQVTPASISVVSWHAFTLPSCKDNILISMLKLSHV